jgi:replication factor C large subunit
MLWTEVYRPETASEVCGHAEVTNSVSDWLKLWKEKRSPDLPRACFLWGPPGVGKTTLVHAVCKDVGYRCIEYNASDIRSASMIKKVRNQSENRYSIWSYYSGNATEEVAILLDELDGICNGDSVAEVLRWVEDPDRVQPLFFTSNTALPALRLKCEPCSFMLTLPGPEVIRNLLRTILEKENRSIDSVDIDAIVKVARGDVRQAITMLQFGNRLPMPPEGKQLDKLIDLLKIGYWHPQALATYNHVIPSVLLHPSCPDELLDQFTDLQPWSPNATAFVAPYLRLLPFADQLKMSAYSALSQWGLYRRTN